MVEKRLQIHNCCVPGGLILYVCRRLNLNGSLEELLEVYGAIHM